MARPITRLNQIEQSAIRLFASRGLADVTIKEIAQASGSAEGSLYRHYASKEELAWFLYKREVEEFSRQLRKVLESRQNYKTRIRESIDLFCSFYDRDPVTFAFILLTQHGSPVKRKLNPASNPEVLVFQFVKAGKKAGAFRTRNVRLATALLLGLILQPAILCAERKLKGPMRKWAEEIDTACFRVLRVREK